MTTYNFKYDNYQILGISLIEGNKYFEDWNDVSNKSDNYTLIIDDLIAEDKINNFIGCNKIYESFILYNKAINKVASEYRKKYINNLFKNELYEAGMILLQTVDDEVFCSNPFTDYTMKEKDEIKLDNLIRKLKEIILFIDSY